MERRPALQKRKMLSHVKAMLIKQDLMEAIIGKLTEILREFTSNFPVKVQALC